MDRLERLIETLYWEAGRVEGVNEARKFRYLVARYIEDDAPEIARRVLDALHWEPFGVRMEGEDKLDGP